MIVILGPTASGKTALAVQLAHKLNAQIISADSRQVYRNMDIGTGKDLAEYNVTGQEIKYHLINILDAGEQYNLAQFQADFEIAYIEILAQKSTPILCGGTGLYIQAIIQNFQKTQIKPNVALRESLSKLSKEQLITEFEISNIENKVFDSSTKKRLIRAIEILKNGETNNSKKTSNIDFKVFGLSPDLETRRERINLRLKSRLNSGLIEEAESLIYNGLSHQMLQYYGLEYKYISYYLLGQMTKEEMIIKLQTEIHRFAKRQMTFFRSMEKKGIEINWIPAQMGLLEQVEYVLNS